MNRKIALSLIPLVFVVNTSFASPVVDDQIIEFQANTPAKADEVNANFSALKSAVNDNDTRVSDHANRLTTIETNPESLMGAKSDSNALNHNRFSATDARSAVTSADLDHKNHNIYNVANIPDGKTYASVVSIRARGLSSTIGGNADTLSEISIDGTQVLEVTRSYGLVVLDRATGNVEFSKVYDIFGSVDEAQALADQLAYYSSDKIVIITTYDEPRNNRLANGLDVQMLRCGASSRFTSSSFKYRSAYALIGICDLGPGTGMEFYSGETDDDTTAAVDTAVTIIDGSFSTTNSIPDLSGLTHLAIELPDFRNKSTVSAAGTWVDIPGRSITFTKRYAHSLLKITYQDTLGTLGKVYSGCVWRILVDTQQVSFFSDADETRRDTIFTGDVTIEQWNMTNAAHMAWVKDKDIGTYTVKVQNKGSTGAWTTGTSECLMGWNTDGNFLSVEEIP